MRTDVFDFELPDEAIALRPVKPRDGARMLVVQPGCPLEDKGVRDLPSYLRPGDALVFNKTRVIPAYFRGVRIREGSQAKISLNLIQRMDDHVWRALARPAKRLEPGDRVQLGHGQSMCHMGSLDATVVGKGADGEVDLAFDLHGPDLDSAFPGGRGDAAATLHRQPQVCRRCGPADVSNRVCHRARCRGGADGGAAFYG